VLVGAMMFADRDPQFLITAAIVSVGRPRGAF
jgi:hypothetical protein